MLDWLRNVFGLKIRGSDIRIDRGDALLAVVALLFLVEINSLVLFSYVSALSSYIMAATSIAFVAYAATYVINKKRSGRRAGILLRCLLAVYIVLVVAEVALVIGYYRANLYDLYYVFFLTLSVVPIFLPLSLLVFLGMGLLKVRVAEKYRRNYRLFAAVLFAVAVMLVVMFYLSKYFIAGGVAVDDEEFIGIQAAIAFTKGINPYTANFGAALFRSVVSGISGLPTLTTTGSLVGTLNYPALFFLVSVPYVLLSNAGAYDFLYSGLFVDMVLFSLILVFIIAHSVEKGHLKLPPVVLILFFLISVSYLSSFVDILMMGMLVLAFYKSGSRYVWVVLGICASLQEQLWIPVLLFLVYSFNNYGLKKGMADLLGTALVFLLINGYFMVAAPHAFISDVFTPVSGYILPSTQSPIGYLLLRAYPIPLGAFTGLFLAAIAAAALVLLYFNQKRLILILSFVPLMFLYHALATYYDFFLAVVIITLYIKDDSAKMPRLRAALGSMQRLYGPAIWAAIALAAIATSAYVMAAHHDFQKAGILVTNATAAVSGNYLIYNATLHYGPGSPSSLLVGEYSAYSSTDVPSESGPLGPNMLSVNGMLVPAENLTANLTNMNRMELSTSGGTIRFSMAMPGNTGNAISTQCVLYHGNYYYVCPDAFVKK